MDETKLNPTDLGSLCWAFSNDGDGLGFFISLVQPGINFSCASTGGEIQL